ncbi:MAG: orotate phosphoribosyltransferase [Acidobacteriota bacterium]|nr:orotate phosphoribosyltransferase [Acidobacteriota bacterium]
MSRAHDIAAILLDLEAVAVSPKKPFTWASGLRSPLYCDNRLIISTVHERRKVADAFTKMIAELGWQPQIIAGTATAGIPHAAWVAELMDLPMVYIRSAEKKHGKKNLIEGRLPKGARVVVIEDLISTGGSSIKAARAVEEAGGKVVGIAAVFQYGMRRAVNGFAEAGYPYDSLTDLASLLDVAENRQQLNAEEKQTVLQWREDPQAWSDNHIA